MMIHWMTPVFMVGVVAMLVVPRMMPQVTTRQKIVKIFVMIGGLGILAAMVPHLK